MNQKNEHIFFFKCTIRQAETVSNVINILNRRLPTGYTVKSLKHVMGGSQVIVGTHLPYDKTSRFIYRILKNCQII